MKIYKVKVNGKVYEVELESVSEVKGTIEVANKQEEVAVPVSGEGAEVKSPVAGSVLEVKVKVGDTVSKGQTIAIVEAMKLENEIVSTGAASWDTDKKPLRGRGVCLQISSVRVGKS